MFYLLEGWMALPVLRLWIMPQANLSTAHQTPIQPKTRAIRASADSPTSWMSANPYITECVPFIKRALT